MAERIFYAIGKWRASWFRETLNTSFLAMNEPAASLIQWYNLERTSKLLLVIKTIPYLLLSLSAMLASRRL